MSEPAQPTANEAQSRGADRRGEVRAWIAVVALTLAALALRLASLDFALPQQQEPDTHILGQVEVLSKPEVSERDIYYSSIYPHLIARAALASGAKPVRGAAPDAPLEQHLRAASALHLHVRSVVAWLSVLLVPASYVLCRLFQSRRAALFAAALAATSLFSFQFGQQARPHAPVAPLVGFALAAAVVLRRRADTASFAAFGGVFALALGCLTNAAAVGLSALPAYFLRENVRGVRRTLDPRALLPLGLAALSLRVFWPFLFVEAPDDAAATSGAPEVAPSSGPLLRALAAGAAFGLGVLGLVANWLRTRPAPAWIGVSAVLALAGGAGLFAMRGETLHIAWQTIRLADFSGGGFELLFKTLWFYEPVALVLFAVGLVAWFAAPRVDPTRARAKDLVVVLAFAVSYALVLGLFEKNQQRFALPLLPVLFCGAAYGCEALAKLAGRRIAYVVLASVALTVPTLATAAYARMRARTHTLEDFASWLRENADPARERIALHLLYDTPLVRREQNLFEEGGAARAIFSPWQRYQQDWMRGWTGERWDIEILCGDRRRWAQIAADPQAHLDELDVDLVALPGEDGAGASPLLAKVRDAVRARGQLVARFPLEERPPTSGLPGLDTPHFTHFVLSCRQLGPQVEVYRLAR